MVHLLNYAQRASNAYSISLSTGIPPALGRQSLSTTKGAAVIPILEMWKLSTKGDLTCWTSELQAWEPSKPESRPQTHLKVKLRLPILLLLIRHYAPWWIWGSS